MNFRVNWIWRLLAAVLGFSAAASYSVAQAETQSALKLSDGFPDAARQPLTPGFGAVAPGKKPNTAVSFFNPKQVAPISYQYNMGVQREVAHDLLVEVGYIANVSHHLTANDLSLNQVPPELMTSGAAQLVRPFPQFSNVTWINPSIGNPRTMPASCAPKSASAAACHSSLTTRFRNFLMTWRPLRSSAPPAATWTPTIAVWIKVSAAATCRTAWL